MILVDFSNLAHRILFVSTMKTGNNVLEYKGMFLHMLFTNLLSLKKEHSKIFGDIILCLDSGSSWRKDIYPEYKNHRAKARDENPIDFTAFYAMLNETLDIISENFPFKVVKVNRAEGDDIIAVLAKNYKEKHLIVSEDKDMKQLLKYSYVSFFRPIQKEYIIMSENELKKWKREHILGGDKSDNIPTIKEGTIFSPNFIKYLKENEIFETDVYSFNKLSISKKLYSEYKGVDKYGKSDIFKGADFGVVSIEKFAKDFWKNIVQNKMWIINYRRNQHLVLFDYMPEWIETETLKCFSELSCNYNPQKIMEYFNDNRLRTLSNNLQDFFISNNQTTISNNSSFDDWF